MKKLMFILLLIIPAFIINAQDVQPKEELATVQVIDHLYDKTSQAISELAKALEIPAEHVYNILVKQQTIQSISSILAILVVSLICFIVIRLTYKDYNYINKQWSEVNNRPDKTHYFDLDDRWWVWAIGTAYVIWSIAIITFFCVLNNVVMGLLNPEYGAIKDIMSIL